MTKASLSKGLQLALQEQVNIIGFGAGLGPQPSDADGISLQIAGNGGVGVTYADRRHFLISGTNGNEAY